VYQNVHIPNPTLSSQEKKLNTYLRLLNGAFSRTTVGQLIHLNDIKAQKEIEQASGGSPVKLFFKDLSEMVNDLLNNAELSRLVDSEEDENKHLFNFMLHSKE